MADDERQDEPQDEQPGAAGEPTEGEEQQGAPAEGAAAPAEDAPAEQPADETPAEPTADAAEDAPADEPASEAPAEQPADETPAEPTADAAEDAPADEPAPEAPAEQPAAEALAEPAAEATDEQRRPRPPRRDDEKPAEETVVPGAHLEPDLVLEERRIAAEGEFDPYADTAATDEEAPVAEGQQAATVEEVPARTPLDLAADARYPATGKRKRAIARVILRPGEGTYTINGRGLDVYFPRTTLQKAARQPLETAGYETRMDVVAKIHGGGVSAQAIALRHGIARALVEADPNLRGELQRAGFLTRDARVKERKKAGLKKARKRPQFSKR
jgi:small subunit ribosomal protein S9